MGKPFTKQEDEIIKKHFGVIPAPELVRLLPGRSRDTVRHHAKKALGLTGGGRKLMSISKTRYTHTKHFFNHPTTECSYWAGFIAADGCISARTISFNLSRKDRSHLELFARDIAFTGPIFDRNYATDMSILRIHAADSLIEALRQNYNITPRKSLTLQPPEGLDEKNRRAFIVGYIDGDGSIKVTLQNYPCVYIRGTEAMLTWIKREFEDIIQDLGNYPIASVRKPSSENGCTYTLTGRRFVTVARKLVELPVPRMKRKWARVQPFFDC